MMPCPCCGRGDVFGEIEDPSPLLRLPGEGWKPLSHGDLDADAADYQRTRPPAADAGEVRERPAKLTMPNGDVLECEYPNGTDWAKSWSIRYPTTGTIGTTGEQDWEIVETYGLTAIANAILALPQAPSPSFGEGVKAACRELDKFIAITRASPFWEERTSVCLDELAAAIRNLGE